MEDLLKIRLGRCSTGDVSAQGFAAAGAVASSGKLIDVTRLYMNVRWSEHKSTHAGYGSESVLSTTLPILKACAGFRTVVYMTSYKFTYASYCAQGLFDARRRDSSLCTLVVVHDADGTYCIDSGHGKTSVGSGDVVRKVEDALSLPMSCAVCDWSDIEAYELLSRSATATLWWYPVSIDSPVESVAPGDSTAYYARAYSSGDGDCLVAGAFYRFGDAREGTTDVLRERWRAYDTLLQSQTCGGGECFSCSYLRGCMRSFTGGAEAESSETLDILLDF
ncbi:hypothetical protein BBP40_012059 [Aspergillus hancockii]|nr:hypothetical protein BBP40_012059 [Aspergillus hancockii]